MLQEWRTCVCVLGNFSAPLLQDLGGADNEGGPTVYLHLRLGAPLHAGKAHVAACRGGKAWSVTSSR